MKIVIVGSGGRLGSALCRAYGGEYAITGFNHSQLDLGSADSIQSRLEPLDFDLLINCAALTNVDYCETRAEEAVKINGTAVGVMGRIAETKNARVIHISTDYVFDGEKRTPYVESDPAVPISVYGESKRQGEIELLEVSDHHLVVRVSWVFGPDRPSFVDQILKRALEFEQVEAIADKFSVPTYTLDLAKYLKPLLFENRAGGILHLSNAGDCTWQQYGQYAIDCAIAAGVPMKGKTVGALRMADLKAFIAKRPVYTVLGTGRLTELTGEQPRDWRDAVEEHVRRHFAPANSNLL
ncbi:MAG: dTDP-4-dehydrorhamnose reductase [Verrucomicrobiota bacterium]